MRRKNHLFELAATDLSNHLACRHLTELDARVAGGLLEKPQWRDPNAEVLQERGLRHEDAYVRSLREAGREIVDLRSFEGATAEERTLAALRAGADAIVQAALGSSEGGRWHGRADVLLRVETPSELGPWSYEVHDTKLSQETRGGTVLQLCLYSDLVGRLQGAPPERMHVVKPDRLGNGTTYVLESFRYADFAAYYRHVRTRLEGFADHLLAVADPDAPFGAYPEPVAHCDVCRWWQRCDRRRRADDHLSLVAGLGRLHADELRSQQRSTRTALADAPTALEHAPARGRRDTYERLRDQAAVQVRGEREDRPVSELLPLSPEELDSSSARRGFRALPAPGPGDVFLDFEGDPFVETETGGGLEYLLGYAYAEPSGELVYVPLWALDRAAEKRAFETFVDFLHAHLARYPDLHVYHFAPYEPAALKRLASRHATRELELDWFLRAERFIDLHAITRGALRASVETYSLKALERFTDFERRVDLRTAAGPALRRVQHALELGRRDDVADADRAVVAGYNEDDCRSLPALQTWLEERRAELVAGGTPLDRPPVKDGAPTEKQEERSAELAALIEKLTRDLPADPAERTPEQAARALLAHLVEYFRREDRVAWWEFFARRDATDEMLFDDRKAIVGLEFVEVLPRTSPRQRVEVHRYRFPAQEVSLKVGTKVCDPRKPHEDDKDTLGKIELIEQVDADRSIVDIRMTLDSADCRPTSLHDADRVLPKPLDEALCELAAWVAENGVDAVADDYRAARDLLLRHEPRRPSSPHALHCESESLPDALVHAALELDGGILAIQGPPGTGKTYNGARLIVELVRQGKRVGISAVSHEVIRNLLKEIREAAASAGVPVTFVHKISSPPREGLPQGWTETKDNDVAVTALSAPATVVGGTAWLWARSDAAQQVDYLVIDEAGQLSLAHVLAAARAAKNLILCGDPQQLQQPQRGAHPEGAEISALSHYLGGRPTIPDTHGFFLAETWRLHASLCRFTSELYYEEKLRPIPALARQALHAPGFPAHGLAYIEVPHEHHLARSDEEVECALALVHRLLLPGNRWTDREGQTRDLTPADVLVIAPYNAQVAALTARLSPLGVRAGTVDKFQGQEAPVVLYSLASSSPDDAPRGLAFLFDPHRLNVATSRARVLCVLVASPALFEPDCKSPPAMRWANGLCRFVELAQRLEP